MGKVLEMSARLTAVVLASTLALVGCGNGPAKDAFKPLQAVAMRLTGMGAAAVKAPAVKAGSGPALTLAVPTMGRQERLRLLDRDGDVAVWLGSDGSQYFLRSGVLIGTRGLGADLMSATVPSPADLARTPAEHLRAHHYLNGTDTSFVRNYRCTVAPAVEEKPSAAYHLIETCDSDVGRIENQYWLSRDLHVIKSLQWVSQGVGYAAFLE